jgi:hypothetical protein
MNAIAEFYRSIYTPVIAGLVSLYVITKIQFSSYGGALAEYWDAGYLSVTLVIFVVAYTIAYGVKVRRRRKTYSVHVKLPDMVIERKEGSRGGDRK